MNTLINWKFGVRYQDGKILFFHANKNGKFANPQQPPAWAVDIREILAMLFVGIAAILLIYKGETTTAMYILLPLLGYAIGRTVPFPTRELKEILKEMEKTKDK